MTRKRTSKLDAGLYELTLGGGAEPRVVAEILKDPVIGSALLSLEREPHRRRAADGRSPVSRGPRVTVKLVTAMGSSARMLDAVRDAGGEVVSTEGQVIVAHVPVPALGALAEVEGLRRAEQAQRLRLRMDEARGALTRCDQALSVRPDLGGDGVVVGVIDTGVDWRHADFRTETGSRIELFIHGFMDAQDQLVTAEYTGADIDQALQGQGQVPKGDPHGHGTHCASIAAGNGRAEPQRRYRGVAPDATLMAMRSDGLFDVHTIEGIRRFFAEAGDRPAVINLSLGSHVGPHDGTSALENAIAEASGPGRIIVVAAGNEGSDRIHFSGDLVMGTDLDIEFTIRDGWQLIDVWIPRGDEADIVVVDPDGTVVQPNGNVQSTPHGDFLADLRVDPMNRDVNLQFRVVAKELGRRWRLRLTPTRVMQGTVHAWGQTEDPNRAFDIFMQRPDPRVTIGMPATEERAISVASFVSRVEIAPGSTSPSGVQLDGISPFSSLGPTRSGVQRPDVAAPGQHVVASLAAGSSMATDPQLASRRVLGDQYISIQGTSMATPFVVGVIALMLQIRPTLTPEDIRTALRATSRRDPSMGSGWNLRFGHGRIDVEALLDYVEDM